MVVAVSKVTRCARSIVMGIWLPSRVVANVQCRADVRRASSAHVLYTGRASVCKGPTEPL
eukprot:11186278-Lingulodinium_polyedra.AAC.1